MTNATRRAGSTHPDPRPAMVDGKVGGVRCNSCEYPSAAPDLQCRRCGAAVTQATFGPQGTVWAIAEVHLQVGDRKPPFTLAYVDLDAGPRVLATVVDFSGRLDAVSEVVVVGTDPHGDLAVTPLRSNEQVKS